MKKIISDHLSLVYKTIEDSRKKYGVLKKCEFHIHTPASYDYKLIDGKHYDNLTIEEIVDFAVELRYLTEENKKAILAEIAFFKSDDYIVKLKRDGEPYTSFKEYLSYTLIAHKLFSEDIEVAVISDHNTIEGFPKLKHAIEDYYKIRIKDRQSKKPIRLFLGVEISCSEKNHLIAIFKDDLYGEVQGYLNEIIDSKEGGTIHPSRTVMEEINNRLGGLTYLAHLNSSQLSGSQVYNEKLFSTEYMDIFGLTNIEVEDRVRNRIKNFSKKAAKSLGVVFEGDSHTVSEIGQKNTWIKFSLVNFSSLKKAVKNHQINIYTKKPAKSNKFLKGIVVFPGEEGFLTNYPSETEEYFHIDFSRDLNCIIGGRGTGKSTVLNIIESVLTTEVEDLQVLEYISKHDKIYIVFYYEGNDYIIEFLPQTNRKNEYYKKDIFLERAFSENESGKIKLSSNWFQLFKVQERNHIKIPTQESLEILSNIYRRSYSINSIINKIDSGEVGQFIRETVLYRMESDEIKSYIYQIQNIGKNRFNKYLRENSQQMIVAVAKRKERIDKYLEKFNHDSTGLIEIVYSPREKNTDYYLNRLLNSLSDDRRVLNTYLTWNDVVHYIQKISEKIGFIQFLHLLFNMKTKELEQHIRISDMVDKRDLSFSDVNNEFEEISPENLSSIYKEIQNTLSLKRVLLQDSIIMWLEVIDDFTLKFNVNSKENSKAQQSLMKDITEMSLGQKVVAILTFVFNFGNFVNDNTPLIIDQPEDNLDNQYIYKNLVESLRQIKNNRQVIIVTHNSTIVTNADTEQVIVMNSNNKKGWVENKGYPTDKAITKLIINNLEGGIESFHHKMETYKLFIKELSRE